MRRRRLTNVVLVLVFVTGLAVLLYPMVADLWNSWREAQLIQDYEATTSQEASQDEALIAGKTAEQWIADATAYNATLPGKGIPDAFAEHTPAESAEYLGQLAYRDDDMMGYIQIPKMGQTLPIYHGTSDAALAKGVGHLQGSALPVGGASTHCVLSAHRGCPRPRCSRTSTSLSWATTSTCMFLTACWLTRSTRSTWLIRTRPSLWT